MPGSPEKRRRERMKQQKRKDKFERRALRREGKRLSPMFHTLRRGAEQHRVETDLWLSVLDLVAVGGWTPPLSEPAAKSASSAYSHPHGLEIARADAKNLGQSIGALLTTISEDQLPPSNSPFGSSTPRRCSPGAQPGEARPGGCLDRARVLERNVQARGRAPRYLPHGRSSLDPSQLTKQELVPSTTF